MVPSVLVIAFSRWASASGRAAAAIVFLFRSPFLRPPVLAWPLVNAMPQTLLQYEIVCSALSRPEPGFFLTPFSFRKTAFEIRPEALHELVGQLLIAGGQHGAQRLAATSCAQCARRCDPPNHDWNLINRAIIPVVWNPDLSPFPSVPQAFAPTDYSAFLSPRNLSGGWTVGAGPIVQLPTATSRTVGSSV